MALSIGDKVYRNMQEQVAYLTKLVAELKQIIKDKEYAIKNVEIENGHLIFTFDDDSTIDAGEVISITGVEINASSHLVITYNDGTSEDLGLIKSITSVTKDASGHIIVAYSDGTSADLGLLKGISSCSLDANKHLIVNYDNGTTQDLGLIFSGTLVLDSVEANSIIELMSGYSFIPNADNTYFYVGAVKNGNKLTFTIFGKLSNAGIELGKFIVPNAIFGALNNIAFTSIASAGIADIRTLSMFLDESGVPQVDIQVYFQKRWDSGIGNNLAVRLVQTTPNLNKLDVSKSYIYRYEITFLLSNTMA